MQSNSPIVTMFLILLLLLSGGCASDRPPSGGPPDTTSLRVTCSDPAPLSVNVSVERISLTFSHEITGRQLLNALIISPPIGDFDMSVNGKKAEINGFKPLEQNKSYIVTLDKKLSDNNGHTLSAPYTMAFSTGAVIDRGTISGKVINTDCSPATNALLLAFREDPQHARAENLLQRKADYCIQAEASGEFSFRHMATGSYRIIAINDRNGDLRYNPSTEEVGLCSATVIPTGSSDLLFRLSGIDKATAPLLSQPVRPAPEPSETGTISGRCFASGQHLIVEATSLTASYSTAASRDRNGTWHYSVTELPPGSYTIIAFVPSSSKKPDSKRKWNPGTIEPYQPSEPFGFYPEKVTVRPQWTTEHIDIRIITSR
jgi:uncharacterized protein (DUF2141 family)